MPTNVIMPQMGESIAEGTLTKWLKNPETRSSATSPSSRSPPTRSTPRSPRRRRHPPRDPRPRGPDRPDQHGRRTPWGGGRTESLRRLPPVAGERREEGFVRRWGARPAARGSVRPQAAPACPPRLLRNPRSLPRSLSPSQKSPPPPQFPPPQPGESQEELLKRRSSPVVRAIAEEKGRRHLADSRHRHLGPRDEAGHRGVP